MAISAAQLEVSFRSSGADRVAGEIDAIDGKVKQATGGFDEFFDSIQGGAGNALRALDGISQAMGAIAVMGGVTLLAGGARDAFGQVSAIEQATFAMSAYGDSAAEVQDVLNDLTDYAQDASRSGGIFWSEDLYSAAQQLIIVGVELENVSEYVQIMSRAVGLGTVSFDELARVLQRVGSAGRITGTDFDMLRQWGFQLDEQLRNTNVTWEELFDNLDRGIPADALLGQADTIQGAFLYLRGAIIDVGQEFLGITEDMEFAAGSLGERIVQGLQAAPDAIRAFGDAAADLGNIIVGVIDFVTNMVNAFRMLPDPIQNTVTWILRAVTAFGALRVAGRAMGVLGTLTGLSGLGGLLGSGGLFRGGAGGARSLSSALGGLLGRLNPVGLAITAVAAAGGYLINSFMEQKAAAEEYEQTVATLESTLESLRRQGMRDRATQGEGLQGIFDGLQDEMNEFLEAFDPANLDVMDDQQIVDLWKAITGEEWRGDMKGAREDITAHWAAIRSELELADTDITALTAKLNEALNDPNINVDAWMLWAEGLLLGADNAEDLSDAVDEILETPLSDWAADGAKGMEALGGSVEDVTASVEELREIFADVPQMASDLRIDGLHREANEIEALSEAFQGFLITQEQYWDDSDMTSAPILRMREVATVAPETAAIVEESWNRIADALSSGDFDNARLIADIMEVIGDESLDGDAKAAEIQAISLALHEYLNVASQVLEVLGRGDLTSMLNLAGLGGDAVAAAANVNELSASMDTLFRVVVGNTDAIGSQFQRLFDWADDLIGEEGVWSKLDDLLAAGRISGEHGVFTGDSEYARAQQAYNSILEDNAAIQEHILTIQAKQAPLLAANASAMEQYMADIANEEDLSKQLSMLGFMDAGLQNQLDTVISLAGHYSALGADGEDAFRAMADGIALTNPALFAMMEQIGLVTEVVRSEDGTVLSYEVNLDGATTVQDSLNDLIESIDALTLALGGIPPVRVDTSEIDPAIEKLNALADAARNAVQAGLGNIGAGGNNSTRTGTRDAGGPETHGNTGVPVVTGLPEAGSGGTVTVDADTSSAHNVLSLLEDRLNALEDRVTTITIDADASASVDPLNEVIRVHNELNQNDVTVTVLADTESAMDDISGVETALDDIDGASAIVYLHAIDFATSTINSVSRSLALLDGSSATVSVGVEFGGLSIPGFADGGVVNSPLAWVGERGPELVSLPKGSYVHTNAESMRIASSSSSSNSRQGSTDNSITVNLSGATFNNTSREEMNAWAQEDLIPGIERAVGDRRTGMGVA